MANESTLATAEAPSAPAPAAAPAAVAPAPAAAAVPPAGAPAAVTNEPAAKPAEGQPPAAETPEAAKAVPVKYEFKPREGVTLDAEIVSEFEAAAKELKLPQAEAQKLFDIGAKLTQKGQAAMADQVKATQASWAEASKVDKEFGGEKLGENLAIAKKALELSPEIKTLLNESKLGDHPEMIRWMVRVGKKLSEDSFVPAAHAPAATDMAKQLYPNHK